MLRFDPSLPLHAQNGGLFVSTCATWTHPERILNSYELVFVKEGVLYLSEEENDFEVRAGEALLLWPGRHHRGTRPSSRDLKFYWAHFTHDALAVMSQEGQLQARQHAAVARPDHVTALFRRLLDDQELFGARSATLSLLMMLILCELARSSQSARTEEGAASVLAGKADVVIQTKFQDAISSSSIAAELRCNPDYLGRVFRAEYGKTLTDAINERRTRHAAALLAETRSGIDEIARQCGFADTVYFRRIFKRNQGMTPGAFRSLHTRTHINHG